MKMILTAGLLALASTMAAAAPMHAGATLGSPNTSVGSRPYDAGGGAGHALGAMPSAGLTSLDQFERGDPDAVVTVGYMGTGGHSRSVGQGLTSLAQFEMGDPDTTPGG